MKNENRRDRTILFAAKIIQAWENEERFLTVGSYEISRAEINEILYQLEFEKITAVDDEIIEYYP